IFVPWGISSSIAIPALGIGFVLLVAKTSILATFISFFESSIAKWRLFRIPDLVAVAIASSMIGIILYYIK
ncbi:MAG: formate hydrogenlyase, partial [Thaumarchaeota archaeon]|nr:formate hydrogenlyase [Nitrososphaerota archaeon]